MKTLHALSKFALLAVVTFGLVFMVTARAKAAAEFCPAMIEGAPQRVSAGVYELRLAAMSERSVTGMAQFETPQGWYTAAFASVKLHEKPKQAVSQANLFMLNGYISDPVYVKMPADVAISYAYVSQASTSGETFFGWDSKGTMPCEPVGLMDSVPPPDPIATPSSHDAIIAAHPIASPVGTACTRPLGKVTFKNAPPMKMPAMFQGGYTALQAKPTIVAVAVDPSGGVVDDWVWQSSGTPVLDDAAANEARKATFGPAQAFCRYVPGYYLFHVTWSM